ncbi:MarR family transcriptional regulator [Halosimplex rubrum]|uniref:MarR family transcriptional regulator n=1 Tax=Halosimplex rubrum TaxID=869889 RepID=A0A7D5TR71_9EURY|nr:helix-turn-helix domain-containing protein [Halosimplex rubrum]QLH79494.1 MarR family transcriptional regulator [Halosimplex rubrum]
MPISIDQFEQTPEQQLRPPAAGSENADRVLAYLTERREEAFTPAEICQGTGVPRGSVGVVLARLEDRGLVRHRGAYWTVSPKATAR